MIKKLNIAFDSLLISYNPNSCLPTVNEKWAAAPWEVSWILWRENLWQLAPSAISKRFLDVYCIVQHNTNPHFSYSSPASQTASVRRGCSATVHLSVHCPLLFSKWGIFAKIITPVGQSDIWYHYKPCNTPSFFFLSFCEREANVAHDQCSVREKRLSEGDAYWLVARSLPYICICFIRNIHSFWQWRNEASHLAPCDTKWTGKWELCG